MNESVEGTLTDRAYWERFWESKPPTIHDSRGPIRDHVREELVRLAGQWVEPNSRWIEIGCANSTFLYDFPRRLHARLDGVDIAEDAIAATRAAITAHGIDATLSLHDFRAVQPEERHSYDGVISYGFAEHFNNCGEVHATFAEYLKPGGLVFTIVPNMTGLPGLLQQWCGNDTFLTHNVLTTATLHAALADAGFEVLYCEPIIGVNLGVVNTSALSKVARSAVNAGTVAFGRTIAATQHWTGRRLGAAHWRSPYLLAVGRRG